MFIRQMRLTLWDGSHPPNKRDQDRLVTNNKQQQPNAPSSGPSEGEARYSQRFFRGRVYTVRTTVAVIQPKKKTVESARRKEEERKKEGEEVRLRTPPSRTRIGSAPHSSLMARSSSRNQGCVKSPSHQSAVWSTVTYYRQCSVIKK